MLVDETPEPVDSPVPAGLAGADGGTNRMPPLVCQAVLANLDLCDSVVGGPTSTFLSSADGIVDLAGDVTVGVSSPADLAGGVTIGVAPSAVAEVASSAVIAKAVSSADLAADVTVGVAFLAVAGVASPADIAEVASLADLAGYVTIGVISSADTVNVVTTGVAFQEKCDVPSGSVCDYDDYFDDGHYDENPGYFDYDDVDSYLDVYGFIEPDDL